jgi:hypothetical protein
MFSLLRQRSRNASPTGGQLQTKPKQTQRMEMQEAQRNPILLDYDCRLPVLESCPVAVCVCVSLIVCLCVCTCV